VIVDGAVANRIGRFRTAYRRNPFRSDFRACAGYVSVRRKVVPEFGLARPDLAGGSGVVGIVLRGTQHVAIKASHSRQADRPRH
jgi:hypothetical protein